MCLSIEKGLNKHGQVKRMCSSPAENELRLPKKDKKEIGFLEQFQKVRITPKKDDILAMPLPMDEQEPSIEEHSYSLPRPEQKIDVSIVIQRGEYHRETIGIKDTDTKLAILNTGRGNIDVAVKHFSRNPQWKSAIEKNVLNGINKEMDSLCATSDPSIMRSNDLMNVTAAKIRKELDQKSPTLVKVLQICTKEDQKSKESKSSLKVVVPATVLLNARNQHLCGWQKKNAVALQNSSCTNMGITRMSRQFMSVSNQTLRRIKKDMAKDHDKAILDSKKAIETEIKEKRMLDILIKETMNKRVIDKNAIKQQLNIFKFKVQSNIKWTFNPPQSKDIMNKVKEDSEKVTEDKEHKVYVDLLEKVIDISKDIPNIDNEKLVLLKAKLEKLSKERYQIVGDNVDMYLRTSHMTSTSQNKDIHWFFLYAINEAVSGLDLPNEPRNLSDLTNLSDLIMDKSDVCDVSEYFAVLWSRIITMWIPGLKSLKRAVVRKIPHAYSDVMSQQSETVPLGLMFKNENEHDELIDILQMIHDLYVPSQKVTVGEKTYTEVLETVFFGGDQLTEERTRNAQRIGMDGDTKRESLGGLEPKNEDWHAFRIAFISMIQLLRNPASSVDPGTMYAHSNVTGNSNAKTSPHDNYNKVKEAFYLYLDAYIVSATLKFFKVDNINDVRVPDSIKFSDRTKQAEWLMETCRTLVKDFVVLTAPDLPTVIETPATSCRVCSKTYKYRKCLIKHEKAIHGIDSECMESDLTNGKDSPIIKDDFVRNYGSVYITLGLLLRNCDDAIRFGDGRRITQMWRILTPFWRASHNTKYALAGLHLSCQQQGLLSAREAHRLQWNRTVNTRSYIGRRVAMDFHIENLNRIVKDSLRHLGSHLTEAAADVAGKSVGPVGDIVSSLDRDLKTSQSHASRDPEKVKEKLQTDFGTVLHQIHVVSNVFDNVPGREFSAFPGFSKDIYKCLDGSSFLTWIKQWVNTWSNDQKLKTKYLEGNGPL